MAAFVAAPALPVVGRRALRASASASGAAPRGVALPARHMGAVRRASVSLSAKKSAAPEVESAASFTTEEVLQTLKEKWDQTENKTSVVLYAGGAVATLWASSTLVAIVNAVPLVRCV